jgi:hypothetical protein
VVNGSAYGSGFGIVLAGAGGIVHSPDKKSLARTLADHFAA